MTNQERQQRAPRAWQVAGLVYNARARQSPTNPEGLFL